MLKDKKDNAHGVNNDDIDYGANPTRFQNGYYQHVDKSHYHGHFPAFDLKLINFTIKKVQMPTILLQERKVTMSSINSKKLS